jgi:Alpha/beta hydrolase domain
MVVSGPVAGGAAVRYAPKADDTVTDATPPARHPEVLGPISGARPPWGDPGPAAEAAGYLVEEYQLEGTAVAYTAAPGTTLDPDGHWTAVVAGEAPYRTRILVVRPQNPAQFNGTVLLNWQNVSAGVESAAPRGGEVYRGYAWVGVSAQEVGIYGFPMGVGRHGPGVPRSLPLVDHDPARYGDLQHPGDQGSFDMFSQAARAVGPRRRAAAAAAAAVDPMGGFDVRRILATGGSQSAMRLVAYINAVHPLDDAVDGFLLSVWEGRAPALEDGPVSFGGLRTTVRDEVAVPVLIVNSEFEATGVHAVGLADGGLIRLWEVAGAPHGVARSRSETPKEGRWGVNSLSIGPVYEAAIRRAHHWVADGVPPQPQPQIKIVANGRAAVSRDHLGNAIGGIRLPELEVPTAEHRGMALSAGRPALFGASRPFNDETLRSLYPNRAEFSARWKGAVDRLIEAGTLLPEDAAAMIARGDEVRLPVA